MIASSTRDRILEFVRSHPAASGRSIQRGLNLAWGETDYHLNRLLRTGLLRRQVEGKFHHYFVPGFPLVEGAVLQVMQGRVARGILVVLARAEGLTFSQLAIEVGESRSLVAFQLRQLVGRGLVTQESTPTSPRYRARDAQLVLRLYGSFLDSFEDHWADRLSSTFGGLLKD